MLQWQTGSEFFSVMTQQQLYEWITHPELLNRDTLYELRTLLARYPYFQTVRLLYLKNLFLLQDITFGEELRKAALYVADRKVLFYLIEGERFTISPLDKQEKPKEEGGLDRTLSLIDAFLSSLPEDSAAMELPMDVTADYTSFLLHEEEHPSDDGIPRMKGQSLIDDFIEKSAEEPLLPQLGIKEAVPVKKEMPEEDEPEAALEERDRNRLTGEILRDALAALDDRSRRVVQARWLRTDTDGNPDPMTLQELAAELGVSAERVRQIEKKAIAKLRTELAADKDIL